MTAGERSLLERVGALRRELDRSFAEPKQLERPELASVLAIRAGEGAYALRFDEIRALVADRPITRVPSPVRELLGLCALRGAIVPVYDLARLLGHSGAGHNGADHDGAPRAARWLVLAQHRELVALAFDALDGQAQVPASELARAPDGASAERAVLVHGALRPLLRMSSVLETIDRLVAPHRSPQGNA